MGANARVAMSSRQQYSRYLGDFRGVDFSSSPAMVSQNRFSFLKNMWKDYESGQGQAIETMPGHRIVLDGLGSGSDRTVYSMYEYRDYVIAKCGTSLYAFLYNENGKISLANGDAPIATDLREGKITGFVFNNDFWFIDGKEYYKCSCPESNGTAAWSVEKVSDSAYIPTTYINGEEYEQRNILTNKFKEKAIVGSEAAKLIGEMTSDGFVYKTYELKDQSKLDGDTTTMVMITGYTGTVTDVLYIPNNIEVDGKICPVGIIADRAFERQGFSQVYIPAKCTIYARAFGNCAKLESIIFKPQPEYGGTGLVHTYAFSGCKPKTITLCAADSSDSTFGATEFQIGAFYTSLKEYDASEGIDALRTELPKIIAGFERFTTPKNLIDYAASRPPSLTGLPLGYTIVDLPNGERQYQWVNTIVENHIYEDYTRGHITLFDPVKSIDEIKLNGETLGEGADEEADFDYTEVTTDGYITKILFEYNKPLTAGDEFEISCTGEWSKFSSSKNGNASIFDANAGYDGSTQGSALDVIRKCSVTAIFDGRVFFTGNPDFPNTVMYSARDLTSANNPAYIGVYNYFNDGVGDKRNTAMISTPSMLVVCKENTKQDGSCWYHVGQDTGYDLIPRVYPSTQGVAGLGCVGAATNFSDDPVFLSTEGLMAIGKETVNLERTLEHRSSNVDLKLKQGDLEGAVMTEWKGYLVILADGKMFLADSRQLFKHDTGVTQYEWYYADDIGIYTDQKKMLSTTTGSIWATVDGEEIDLLQEADLRYSVNGGGSGIVYVNKTDESQRYDADAEHLIAENASILVGEQDTGLKFPIVMTDKGAYIAQYVDQYSMGEFQAAVSLCNYGGKLLLGTKHGEILCMNTDMRGRTVYRAVRPPEYIADSETYAIPANDMIFTDSDNPVEIEGEPYYSITTGGVKYLLERIDVEADEIWSGFYNRNGREIEAVCETLCDPSAYPQIAKNTVRKSTVVRTKAMGVSEYRAFVRSNREQEWKECRRTSRMGNMEDLEFGNMSYLTTDIVISVIPDRKKRWQWQQFRFESNGYCKPFGLLDMFYRYENGGNIK